ncbi:putative GNAT superfamily acetyltransferase [Nocardioides cavernae]|uniref:Putative GNAT superfamily acetyltransferase n=1 Tax=Nocardioides cavernae TaxID=1921566 RepID=A0A7Y9H1I9_9ACTN|nr:GNAT family N-acetyltransferase [Nocardioides cavernae]NYE36120.1 putative GNAT superfamily acetyltransferase [Nocardioides cavernae]
MSTPTAVASELDAAVQGADAAARAAGVVVRTLDELPDLAQAVALFGDIWKRSGSPPLTVELLRALTKAGNYVGGAYADGRLVGACVGFFHAPEEDSLHSHIAGVAPGAAGRNVGFALKLHQRAWAIARGVHEVVWTFDPLVARNAWFNLVKLGARATEYLPNFYGPMDDGINGADESDRLLVRWRLTEPAVALACAGGGVGAVAADLLAGGAVVAVGRDDAGRPAPGRLDGGVSLVAVPPDVAALRATDPDAARQWRSAVREGLTTLLADGAGRIEGFDRSGWYVVRREQ